MDYSKKYLLQARIHVRGEDKLMKWADVETADSKAELLAMIPIGEESNFQIIEVHKFKKVNAAEFSKRFRAIVDKLNMTQGEIASLCKVSQTAIGNYLRAECVPQIETADRLCKGLNISWEDLCGGETV